MQPQIKQAKPGDNLDNRLPRGGAGKSGGDFDTWNILFLASLFFLSYNGRSITGPLLPSLEQDLGLSHAECGGLFVFLFAGYLVSLLGSGIVAAVIGHRRTIILSAAGLGATLMAVAGSNTVWALRIGLIAVGFSAGLYPPSGIAALTRLAKPAYWGRAMGIHDIAPNVSIVAAPAVAGLLVGVTSWRGVYFLFGVVALLVGLAFFRFGPPVSGRGQVPDLNKAKVLLGKPPLWIMCFLFSLGGAGLIGVYNMLPLYLTSVHGLEASSANLIVALSRIPGIGMCLVAGWFSDLVGPRRAIAVVLAGAGLFGILIGLLSGAALMIAIFLQAAVAICFFPAGLAAVSRLFSFELRNLAIAIAVAFSSFVGSGLVSALMGLFADAGMFSAGLICNGVLVLAGLPALAFLRLRAPSEE